MRHWPLLGEVACAVATEYDRDTRRERSKDAHCKSRVWCYFKLAGRLGFFLFALALPGLSSVPKQPGYVPHACEASGPDPCSGEALEPSADEAIPAGERFPRNFHHGEFV